MSKSPPNRWPWWRRRQYVIDKPTQMLVAWQVVGVLVTIGVLYALAVFVLLDADLVQAMDAPETRRFMLVVHTAYFALGGAMLAVTAVLLSHRFVGPAMVIRQAIQGMRRGDDSCRLKLRQRDYHKDLAGELEGFRAELGARERARAELLAQLGEALDRNDEEAARALLREVQATSRRSTAAPPRPAPSLATAAK